MNLNTYICQFPREQRHAVRKRIADAHSVAVNTVTGWSTGWRKHPATLTAVETTEAVTDHQVTRHDVRPDVYGPPENAEPGSEILVQRRKRSKYGR